MVVMYTSIALSFAFLCGITCCIQNARTYPTNYILLGGFTLCEAVMLSCACLFANAAAVGMAAGMTFLVTAGLTTYACTTKTDFTGMGPYLFAALLSLMIFGFIASLFSWIFPGKPPLPSYHRAATRLATRRRRAHCTRGARTPACVRSVLTRRRLGAQGLRSCSMCTRGAAACSLACTSFTTPS